MLGQCGISTACHILVSEICLDV